MNGDFLSQEADFLQDGLFLNADPDEEANEIVFVHLDEEDDDLWDDTVLDELEDGEIKVFLNEAHEAMERLQHRTNKRGREMKKPRRAESWQ